MENKQCKNSTGIGTIRTVRQLAVVIKGMLEQRYGDRFHVTVCEVGKNNGVKLTGVTIREEGFNIAPNIYLDDYFEEYRSGKTVDDICRAVTDVYEKNRIRQNFNLDEFVEFDTVRDQICFKLINAESNRSLLSEIPHRLFLDLAVVYYVLHFQNKGGIATTAVNDRLMEMWGTDEAMLYECAKVNTPKLMKGCIFPMTDIFLEDLGSLFDMGENVDDASSCYMNISDTEAMHIATNAVQLNGADIVLYDGVLKAFAEKVGGDFYILPSSVHECLFYPVSRIKMDGAGLGQMVRGINQTTVQPDEVLSGHTYRYFSEADRLEIVG